MVWEARSKSLWFGLEHYAHYGIGPKWAAAQGRGSERARQWRWLLNPRFHWAKCSAKLRLQHAQELLGIHYKHSAVRSGEKVAKINRVVYNWVKTRLPKSIVKIPNDRSGNYR